MARKRRSVSRAWCVDHIENIEAMMNDFVYRDKTPGEENLARFADELRRLQTERDAYRALLADDSVWVLPPNQKLPKTPPRKNDYAKPL